MSEQPTASAQEIAELAELHIRESSGVNQPAHEVEGWMVLKNRQPMSDDELAEVLAAASASAPAPIAKHDQGSTSHTHEKPPTTVAGASGNTATATEPVAKKGSYQGTDYAECVRVSVEQDGMSPEEAAAFCRTATAGGEAVTTEATEVGKSTGSDQERIAQLEAELAALRSDPVEKALVEYEVPEPIREVILKSRSDAQEAIAKAAAEHDLRVTAEWVEVAKSYRSLSAQPSKLGPVLKRLYESSPQDYKIVEDVLKGAEGAIRHSSLFAQLGSDQAMPDSEPKSSLEAMAKAKAEADSIPYEKAFDLVAQTPEGRALYAQYLAERGNR